MVSIIPSQRSSWDVIGDMLGQNLSQNLPRAIEQGYERQRGLSAIDNLQTELQSAGGDISKTLPALARALTLNKNLERSGLAQQFLINSAQGLYPGALGQGAGGQPTSPQAGAMVDQPAAQAVSQQEIPFISSETQQNQPATAEGKKSPRDIDSIANQYIGEVRPDLVNPATQFGAINTFDSEIKQDLSPEEESRLRQQLMDKYKNPNIVNPVIDRIREGIKNRYNEAQAKYGFDQDRLNQIKGKWNEFTQGTEARLEPHLGKYNGSGESPGFPKTKEVLRNKYNQYAAAFPTNLTPEQMHTNAMELLQRDLNKLDALQALPSLPPIRGNESMKEYMDTYKEQYKDLADQGFLEALREDAIMNKDMGNEEFHSLIWGDQTNKDVLNSLHGLKAPVEYPEKKYAPGIKEYNSKYPEERQRYVREVSNKLRKLSPTDDLILSRAMVLDNGGTVQDFQEALKQAQQNGLKLSEFQKQQLQETGIPRRPPLWELFSDQGQGGIGPFKFMNWGPFINYLRGKK